MLHRIIGKSGSGKTRVIVGGIGECVRFRRRCFVIVPEQQSVSFERLLADELGDGFNLYCEVLNFERLPNRVARRYGGLTARYMDKGSRSVLLASAVRRVSGTLSEYSALADSTDFIRRAGETLESALQRGITADRMLETAERLPDGALKNKIKDLGRIGREYSRIMPEGLSDPADALTALADRLGSDRFFEGSTVFIDGCYTYTFPEMKIIERIIDQAEDVYISFVIGDDEELYRETIACADAIKALSRRGCEDTVLTENRRAVCPEIAYLQDSLWDPCADKYTGERGGVSAVTASDRFAEAHAVSAEIYSLLRKGYRCRDISIIIDNASEYDGIIDTVLASDGIPCFMSVKKELATEPPVAFVMAAVELAATDFSPGAVRRYLKNSYSGLTVRERDLLSRYAELWDIRGRRWYDGREWLMNPDGYVPELTPRAGRALAEINRAREKMLAPLLPAFETLRSGGLTVRSAVGALYSLLVDSGADRRLLAKSREKLSCGDEAESDRLSQVWNTLIDVFDRLCDICGSEETDPGRLYSYLSLMLSERSVGAIPPSADAVTVGTARLIRPDRCRAAILMGVCDGEFPRAAGPGALFTDREIDILAGAGLDMALPFMRRQNEERFFFTAAVSAPSDRLIFTFPRGGLSGEIKSPSVALLRVKELLGISEYRFGSDSADMLYCREAALRSAGTAEDPAVRALIAEKCGVTQAAPPLTDTVARVTTVGSEINLTPSRTDRYSLCAFSFFARYLLKLRENRRAEFSAPEIGTFVHKILEEFVSGRCPDGEYRPADREAISAEADRLTDEYILSVVGEQGDSPRFRYSVARFKRTLRLIMANINNEFAQSGFSPSGTEVRIGMGDLPAVEIPAGYGKVRLCGIIDRTDTCVIDGRTYLRVVDYKTGKKRFSLEKVGKGLDMQMLMYLFACCAADRTGNTYPAGVLYMPAYPPEVDSDGGDGDEYIELTAEKSIRKSGLVLADPDVIRAMERDGGGVFIPVKLNRDGTVSARGTSAKTLEEFDRLKDELTERISDMGKKLISGNMDISPLKDGRENACRFCEYKAFCRYRA